MRKPFLSAIAVVLLLATGAASPTADLRIAAISATPGECAPLDGSADPGEKAYYEHLAKRLGVKVLKCPVADAVAAGAALAAGKLDMAVLDPAAFAPIQAATRSILTIRPEGGLNRVPVILAVLPTSPAKTLEDLKGKTLIFGGTTPAARVLPVKSLADRGAGDGFFGATVFEPDGDAALAKLRAGGGDAMVLHAAAWQRLCRPDDPKEKPACDDLRVLMKIRPQAAHAIVVRKDIPAETRLRLIGIHMPLHLENKPAFAWASSWAPTPAEFEPTEALALVATR